MPTALDLTLPLTHPITLERGPRSHLVTLMDAAILIRDLDRFRQARPVWDRAAEMILVAAEPRSVRTLPRRPGKCSWRWSARIGGRDEGMGLLAHSRAVRYLRRSLGHAGPIQ
jgi:hypothetical protein